MKRIILLITLVFLCNSFIIAQKTISKKDFELLVDYANCKYVQAFIEKNDAGKSYFVDTYEKKVKPELEKASIENLEAVIGYKNLEELLANNIPALELAKKINERKSKFDEFQDDETLINSLSTTGWKNVDLIKTATNIQTEILSKYNLLNKQNSYKTSESEVVKNQTIQTSRQVEDLQLKLEKIQQQYEDLKNDTKIIEYKNSFNNFRIISLSIFGFLFIIILAFYFLLNKGTSRDYIIKQIIESKRIEEKFARQENAKVYNLSEKDINSIVDKVFENKRFKENDSQKLKLIEGKETIEPSKSVTKYLKGKSGKIFSRVENTPDNSFFKLFNESDDIAQFEFYGDESEAIAKRIFSEDICIIVSGGYQNAQSVKTHKPGKIKRISDHWEVIEPLEIKLV